MIMDQKTAKGSFWLIQKPHVSIKEISKAGNGFVNYTGKIAGDLLVTGYLGRGKWQLKCQCGNYCGRSSSSLGKGDGRYTCSECYTNLMIKSKGISLMCPVDFANKYSEKIDHY